MHWLTWLFLISDLIISEARICIWVSLTLIPRPFSVKRDACLNQRAQVVHGGRYSVKFREGQKGEGLCSLQRNLDLTQHDDI